MFNEYGDSIYSGQYFAKAEKAKPEHEIEKQRLLDTIEHLRFMLRRLSKGKHSFGKDDKVYQNYQQKCEELRKTNYELMTSNEKYIKRISNLENMVKNYERRIKIEEAKTSIGYSIEDGPIF